MTRAAWLLAAGLVWACPEPAVALRWTDPQGGAWPVPLQIEVEAQPEIFGWWLQLQLGDISEAAGVHSAPLSFPQAWGCPQIRARWRWCEGDVLEASDWSNIVRSGECLDPAPVPIPVPEPEGLALLLVGVVALLVGGSEKLRRCNPDAQTTRRAIVRPGLAHFLPRPRRSR